MSMAPVSVEPKAEDPFGFGDINANQANPVVEKTQAPETNPDMFGFGEPPAAESSNMNAGD